MQFKKTSGFVWMSGLSERYILVLAVQCDFIHAIVKAYDTPVEGSFLPRAGISSCSLYLLLRSQEPGMTTDFFFSFAF